MYLREVAKAVDGRLMGSDIVIEGVSTDTRAIHSGDLFVALHGPHFNGHRFIEEAGRHQAAGAMIDELIETNLNTVRVADTRVALGELGAHWRAKFDIPLIGVTGSNGKTTVKQMIGAILNKKGDALITEGNLNNEIGVPLTLLRLRDTHRYAVVEMGTNHVGEIDYLSRMTRPTIALITNAAAAHLEGLGDVKSVAEAKGEIFNGLDDAGIAVINADDAHASLWRRQVGGRRCLRFALHHKADVTAEYELSVEASRLRMRTFAGDIDVVLPLPGLHNVANALAATCAVLAAGIGLAQVKDGLSTMAPVAGRLQRRKGIHGAVVYDDTYNANPASARVAIDFLSQTTGKKLLVLGDMAELGEQHEVLHRDIGDYAREHDIDILFALGPLSGETVQAFGSRGTHFEDQEALIRAVRDELGEGTTVLVKGSRCMHMERVISQIVQQNDIVSSEGFH
jgi:UDP-N-acetylmuramoyl-tripeptide--D-alanyl-D-alanine ligase